MLGDVVVVVVGGNGVVMASLGMTKRGILLREKLRVGRARGVLTHSCLQIVFFLFTFLLGTGAPVCVIYGSVLQEGGKDKHETHYKVDVYCLYVGNSGQ